jgi:hypothetical protein
MNTSESFQALRRANPRTRVDFAESVAAAADSVRTVIVSAPTHQVQSAGATRNPRRRLVHASADGATLAAAAAAAAAAFLTVGSPGGGPGVESAAAAVKKAATLTATSAERSGTAVVRITHDGRLWAGKTVSWSGADVAIADDAPSRPGRLGKELRVVDGTLWSRTSISARLRRRSHPRTRDL